MTLEWPSADAVVSMLLVLSLVQLVLLLQLLGKK